MNKNIILNTDSYKASMFRQYPANTTKVFSYIESRGGLYNETLFFGLQAFIKEYLQTPITQDNIDEAEEVWKLHGEPFNKSDWQYILDEYDGYLPVAIHAVPEGTVVPVKNVLLTIQNVDNKCFWLTTWLETALLRAVWYPTTVATQSWEIKQTILNYLEQTGDPTTINFKLHDFGARGVSSLESGSLGGMAHLVNFMGTDTISGVLAARKYYYAEMAGYSIPAMEHSTVTSWGRDNEVKAYRNMLNQYANQNSVVAVVSDSYDIYNACENIWGEELRQQVIDSGATIVIRPDSGDPVVVIKRLLNILGDKFGITRNEKGYKVLNNVRLIQGDGVDPLSIRTILSMMSINGWSADNIAFGMGGALLQRIDRDTQKFAMKCSAVEIGGEWIDVYKDPITDSGKKSKKGRIALYKNAHGGYVTQRDLGAPSELQLVYLNGELYNEINFEQVRANSNKEYLNEY